MESRDVRSEIEHLLASASAGLLTRRAVLRRAVALGLTAPVVAQLLAACGGDEAATDTDTNVDPTQASESGNATATTSSAATDADDDATEETDVSPETGEGDATEEAEATEPATENAQASGPAGGGGLLRILQWQAPTILNPHQSTGYKDYDASRIAYQPLADFDIEGNGIPVLATEFPTVANGGVAEDGRSVTWTLREGVTWHDGEPFTSADVRFTWEYATHPETGAVTSGAFRSVSDIETPDDYTVVVHFADQNPAGFEVFTGRNGMIIPEHIFRDFMGAEARNAPANLEPVGTGPFMVREFRPGDVVLY
ncbi:MAG: ABC transporter substrate-binding protein, partial [Chloroflexota bacterium]|nr:ABC transporter substrate-binding protein [Chloroflexota bacterium]